MRTPAFLLGLLLSAFGFASEAVLAPFVERGELAGAVALVANKDKVLSVTTVGFADMGAKKPMTADAVFWIASQSKGITAAAVMMLVDEGKISLDDPIAKYVADVPDGDNITIASTLMPWYHGPTLLQALEQWEPLDSRAGAAEVERPFRFPVQFIVRAEGNFRGYAGTVVSGSIGRGDKVVIADSGRTAVVDRIVTYDLHVDGHIADLDRAETGQAVTITSTTRSTSARSSSTCAEVDHAPVLVLVPPDIPILPKMMSPICLGLPTLIGSPASS